MRQLQPDRCGRHAGMRCGTRPIRELNFAVSTLATLRSSVELPYVIAAVFDTG